MDVTWVTSDLISESTDQLRLCFYNWKTDYCNTGCKINFKKQHLSPWKKIWFWICKVDSEYVSSFFTKYTNTQKHLPTTKEPILKKLKTVNKAVKIVHIKQSKINNSPTNTLQQRTELNHD